MMDLLVLILIDLVFKRLLEDIENGRINCVITKDLSRLGKNYVTCGYYVGEYFLLKKLDISQCLIK